MFLFLAFFPALVTAFVSLTHCSVAPGEYLKLGTESVLCQFDIDTDRFLYRTESVRVRVFGGVQLDLPHFVTALDGKLDSHESPLGHASHILSAGTGKHMLNVIFPYTECTVQSNSITVHVVDERDNSSAEAKFKQALACAFTKSSFDPEQATQATATFLGVFLCIVVAIFCILCIYVNPKTE